MGKQETVSPYLIWIDMEMTGLDPDTDRILEVALVATDNDLNVVGVLEPIAVHQSDAVLAAMDAWCQKTHGASGLIERVRASTVTEAEAEAPEASAPKEAADRGGRAVRQGRGRAARWRIGRGSSA
ncbi:MAG TPA: exonuclease domain-containing protein [Hydrogenophilus thermoluteolus]|nr:exonuclease domain-containing protein [Hydrogenophilus thermoluteolus]